MNVCNDLQAAQPASAGARVLAAGPAAVKPRARTSSEAADEATVTGAAKLAGLAAALPDVRMEKVQAVQAAIANGDYKISADDVAGSLINHMLGDKE